MDHKLSPAQLTWLHLVYGKILYLPQHLLLMVYVEFILYNDFVEAIFAKCWHVCQCVIFWNMLGQLFMMLVVTDVVVTSSL